MNPLPFDELDKFKEKLPSHFENGVIRSEQDKEDIIDELLDLFLLSAARGQEQANDSLESDIHLGTKSAVDIIDREIAGKTWRDRVNEYFENGGTEADIMRIAETEAHRDANEAGYATAAKAGATRKVWHCLMIPTSRDSHIHLDGVSAPIDGEFYSINGGSTKFPGEWGIAEEDCGCLCWLTFEK